MSKQKRLAKITTDCAMDNSWNMVYWWKMIGSNGRIICNSKTFHRRQDAKRAMRRAIAIIKGGEFKVVE